jgi:hypothetical protein
LSQTAQRLEATGEKPKGTLAKVEVVRKPTGNIVRDNPSEAGKRGAVVREEKALARIGQARSILASKSPQVARRAVAGALGETFVAPHEVTLINSVLDRTVGKAPTEIRVGMAEQTMQVLDMLELED